MGETKDPRAALQDPSVAVRAKAARDLARVGTFEDLEPLMALALNVKSSALRLYAAAAIADILHRYRGIRGLPELTAAQKERLGTWSRAFDPGTNPALLMMFSAMDDDASRTRLARMLRDPRNTVRAGAAVALRRMALSSVAAGNKGIEGLIRDTLHDKKTPPDALLEVSRIVGEVGLHDQRDRLTELVARGGMLAEGGTEALRRLDQRKKPEGWSGVYRGVGLDVFEPGEGGEPAHLLIADGKVADAEGVRPLSLVDDGARFGKDQTPVRMVFASPIGEPEATLAVLQRGDTTWWRLEGKDLLKTLEEGLDGLTPEGNALLAHLDDELAASESTIAPRVRAVTAWRAGNLTHADALLTEQLEAKKPKADLFYWHAVVKRDLGDKKAAKKLVAAYLEEAPKTARLREAAEALADAL